MNILILSPWYPDERTPHNGWFVKQQALALSKKHNVTMVSIKNDAPGFTLFGGEQVETIKQGSFCEVFIRIPKSIPIYNQYNFLRTAYNYIDKQLMQKTKYDLVHAFISYPGGILANWLSKKHKIPYFITEETSIFEQLFRSRIHKYLTLKAVREAKEVMPVSDGLAREIKKYVDREYNSMANLVDTAQFRMTTAGTAENLPIQIGFLGNLNTPQKGLDILLKAAAKLNHRNFVLNIAGGGELLPDYIIMAEQLGLAANCMFLDRVNPNTVPDFFASQHFFVLSSRKESFGVVVIEAMASGLPVIATICDGPEYIVTKETGILIEIENPEALTEAMNYMINNLDSYDREQIREYIEQQFSGPVVVERIEKQYSKHLS